MGDVGGARGRSADVGAWLERAAARTVKHLREEDDAVELVARVAGQEVRRLAPPDVEMLADVQAVERAANGVVMGQVSGGEGEGEGEGEGALPTSQLRLSVSDEVARFWRGLERVHAYVAEDDESFVAFLVRAIEAMGNQVSLCTRCHLESVHRGRLAVSGHADAEGTSLEWRAQGWEVSGCKLLRVATVPV